MHIFYSVMSDDFVLLNISFS